MGSLQVKSGVNQPEHFLSILAGTFCTFGIVPLASCVCTVHCTLAPQVHHIPIMPRVAILLKGSEVPLNREQQSVTLQPKAPIEDKKV